MVGVGGRSKACDNCRRRRVKCDLTRPSCWRCVKARLYCGGPLDIAIIPYRGGVNSSSSVAQPRDEVLTSATDWRSASISPDCYSIDTRRFFPNDDLFSTFTHLHLIPGHEEIVVAPGTERAMAGQCWLALSTTYFGIKHQDRAITQYGLRRYGSALTSLHKALEDLGGSRSFEVLEAVMIMGLVEFLIADCEDGWIKHCRGLERLFSMRSPEEMASLPCLMVLERSRPSIILAAIVLHQPTILATSDWKIKPWLQYPERIDSLKALFDILADCAELFVLRDQLTSSSVTDPHFGMLLQKSNNIIYNLQEWEQHWIHTPPHTCTEIPSPPTAPILKDTSGQLTPAWATVLQYRSLYHANTLTVYNGTLILATKFLQSLMVKMDYFQQCEALQHRMESAGLNICRSVDYHLEQSFGEKGSLDLLFPLRMAYDALSKSNPEIGIWIQGVLADVAVGRRGLWKSAKTLLEINNDGR
ncbi:Nn.00g027940.m01.CDS01 [Neocucurbitaria sp. VM-36]